MSTLSQLAQSKRTTSVGGVSSNSASSAGGTNIQPTKQIDDNSKLVNDIGKMFGNTMKVHQDASEYAGNIVGLDNLVSYKEEMNTIAEKYNKADLQAKELQSKSGEEYQAYQRYLLKGHFGNNELANEAFKKSFAIPATDDLWKRKHNNDNMYIKLYRKELQKDTKEKINTLGESIHDGNGSIISTLKQKYVKAGLDPRLVTELVLANSSDRLSVELQDNISLYINDAGKINDDSVEQLVPSFFKENSNSKDDSIKAYIAKSKKAIDGYVKAKANEKHTKYLNEAETTLRNLMHKGVPVTEEDGTVHRYATSVKDFRDSLHNKHPLLSKEDEAMLVSKWKEESNRNGGYPLNSSIEDVKRDIEEYQNRFYKNGENSTSEVDRELDKRVELLLNSPFVDANHKENLKDFIRTRDRNRQTTNEVVAKSDLIMKGTINSKDAHEWLNTSSQLDDGTIATASEKMALYSKRISTLGLKAEQIDVSTKEGMVKFKQELQNINRLQNSLNPTARPYIFNKYDSIITKKENIDTLSYNEIAQFAQYMDFENTNNAGKYQAYAGNVRNIMNHIKLLEKDEVMSPSQKLSSLRIYTKHALRFQNIPTNARSMFSKALVSIATDGFNTGGASNTINTLMDVYNGDYTPEAINNYLDSYSTYDTKSVAYENDKQRILVPKSFSDKDKIDSLVEYYKDKEGVNDYRDLSYVAFTHTDNSGSSFIAYRLMYKKTGTNDVPKEIGIITLEAYNKNVAKD